MSEAEQTIAARKAQGANVWIAAGDGDLERVKFWLEEGGTWSTDAGMTPTTPDDSKYTPLHAAASYGQHDVLRLLKEHTDKPSEAISAEDDDGDTPLFFCEDVDTARLLIEEWDADATHKNHEGVTAAEHALANELSDVASYLASVTGETLPDRTALMARLGEDDDDARERDLADRLEEDEGYQSGDHGTEAPEDEDERIDAMMRRVEEIMTHAEATGEDPTDALREVVGAALVRQVLEGYERA